MTPTFQHCSFPPPVHPRPGSVQPPARLAVAQSEGGFVWPKSDEAGLPRRSFERRRVKPENKASRTWSNLVKPKLFLPQRSAFRQITHPMFLPPYFCQLRWCVVPCSGGLPSPGRFPLSSLVCFVRLSPRPKPSSPHFVGSL